MPFTSEGRDVEGLMAREIMDAVKESGDPDLFRELGNLPALIPAKIGN